MAARKSSALPVILLAVSIASIAVSAVLLLSGFYFFFIPFAFGLPWSVKKIREERHRWNVEDLR
jgi:hypothetical protein